MTLSSCTGGVLPTRSSPHWTWSKHTSFMLTRPDVRDAVSSIGYIVWFTTELTTAWRLGVIYFVCGKERCPGEVCDSYCQSSDSRDLFNLPAHPRLREYLWADRVGEQPMRASIACSVSKTSGVDTRRRLVKNTRRRRPRSAAGHSSTHFRLSSKSYRSSDRKTQPNWSSVQVHPPPHQRTLQRQQRRHQRHPTATSAKGLLHAKAGRSPSIPGGAVTNLRPRAETRQEEHQETSARDRWRLPHLFC